MASSFMAQRAEQMRRGDRSDPRDAVGPSSPDAKSSARTPPATGARWWGRKSPFIDIAKAGLLFAAIGWLTYVGAEAMHYNWQWYRVPAFFYRVVDGELIWGPLARGVVVTLELGAYSMVLTILIGLVIALLRLSGSFAGRVLATVYLETIRNTPLLVQLFLFYFVLAPIIGIDRFWAGVLCLSFFEGSFASEIIRAGILSVPRGQREAADSLGLTRPNSLRLVVLPQALPLILPPMTGLAVSLIKHSAIVSVIAVEELTTQGLNLIADTFMAFEIWLTVAAIYLVICTSLSVAVSWLESRMRFQR